MNRLLNKYRQSHGCKVISKGMPIREIIRALRNNEIVGMLVDQDAGKNGVFVNLFNKPASWHKGVMEFALSTGCQVIPGFIVRQDSSKFKAIVYDPIVFPPTGTDEEKIKEGFIQFASRLEDIIKRHPDQWLWQHKRWKSSPQKKVLILNDTRTGHLRQSQAVVSQLEKIYQEKGIAKDDVLTEVIDVKFKNNFTKQILYATSHFQGRFCQGCMSCLKFALTEQNYKKISRAYADIIISCGSKTAAVNLLLSKECNAKSIIIMNPGALLIKKFNLALIPRHDNPKKLKNTIVTEGAPNLIDKQLIEYQANSLRYELGKLSEFKIGLLLGGDYKTFRMQETIIGGIIDQIKNTAESIGADIMATTSRRTPDGIEKILKTKFSNNPRCKLLVIANESNKEGAVGAILGLSNVVIVSPESISMISEAASSGSYVIVFDQGDILDKRHRLFLGNLSNKGYINIVRAKDISQSIEKFFKENPKTKILNDNPAIKKGLERII